MLGPSWSALGRSAPGDCSALSRSLLVSHWYVDSYATVALITKAFDALKRDPKIGRAGALRQAMLSLVNEGERAWHPAYWAPFVVVGEGSSANTQTDTLSIFDWLLKSAWTEQ